MSTTVLPFVNRTVKLGICFAIGSYYPRSSNFVAIRRLTIFLVLISNFIALRVETQRIIKISKMKCI